MMKFSLRDKSRISCFKQSSHALRGSCTKAAAIIIIDIKDDEALATSFQQVFFNVFQKLPKEFYELVLIEAWRSSILNFSTKMPFAKSKEGHFLHV